MATTPIDSWAVDLANVTFIYPGVGWEVPMTILAVVLWIAWHVWQCKSENQIYEEEKQKYGNPDTIKDSIDGG